MSLLTKRFARNDSKPCPARRRLDFGTTDPAVEALIPGKFGDYNGILVPVKTSFSRRSGKAQNVST